MCIRDRYIKDTIYIQITTKGVKLQPSTHWIQFRDRKYFDRDGKPLPNVTHKSKFYDKGQGKVIELFHPKADCPYLDTFRDSIYKDTASTEGMSSGLHFRSNNELSIMDKPGFEDQSDKFGKIVATYDSYIVDSEDKKVYYHVKWSVTTEMGDDGKWKSPVYEVLGGGPTDKLPPGVGDEFIVGYRDMTGNMPKDPIRLKNPYPAK